MIAAAAVPVTPPAPGALVLPAGDFAAAGPIAGAPGVPQAATWSARGRPGFAWPAPGAPVRVSGNTTLVSPPVVVPVAARWLVIRAGSVSGAFMVVRAEPLDGGAPVELGVVSPGTAIAASSVPVGLVAGRSVRLVLDPVGALGESADVAEVGPFVAALAGWSVTPAAALAAPRGPLVIGDRAMTMTAPLVRLPADARALVVSARGSGQVRVGAGGRRVGATLTRTWRDVVLPVSSRQVRLTVAVDPDGGVAHLRAVGLLVRQPRLTVAARRRGGAVDVRARVGECATRVRVTLDGRTRVLPVRAGLVATRLRAPTGARLVVATLPTRLCLSSQQTLRR